MSSTPSGTEAMSTSSDEEYQPPCRQAARYLTQCPLCGRRVQLKTLKYSHRCGRSFDPAKRALEQQRFAEIALKSRMSQKK